MRRRLEHLKFKAALLAAGAWHTVQWWGTRRRDRKTLEAARGRKRDLRIRRYR